MSIIKKAKELQQAVDAAVIKKAETVSAEAARIKERIGWVTEAVLKSLDELDNHKSFSVKRCNATATTVVAQLFRNQAPMCNLCVRAESYKFKGSDESPEETAVHIVVELRELPPLDRPTFTVNDGFGGPTDLARMVDEFEQQMALYLQPYLNASS